MGKVISLEASSVARRAVPMVVASNLGLEVTFADNVAIPRCRRYN